MPPRTFDHYKDGGQNVTLEVRPLQGGGQNATLVTRPLQDERYTSLFYSLEVDLRASAEVFSIKFFGFDWSYQTSPLKSAQQKKGAPNWKTILACLLKGREA